MRLLVRFTLLASFLGATASALAFAKVHAAPDGLLPGLKVDGETVGEARGLERVIHERAEMLLARKVDVVLAEGEPVDRVVLTRTLGDLGVSVDERETRARAMRAGDSGSIVERADRVRAARAGDVDVPLAVDVDTTRALAWIEPLKETEDKSPISARLDLDRHLIVSEQNGSYISAWDVVSQLERLASHANASRLVLPMHASTPRVSRAMLEKLDISTVLGEYETSFSRGGDQQRRGKNIDNAAERLDGLVLSPGEVVSFNRVVGERSEQNGFEKSWEIFKGEMVEGVGGGTCQVASTFHAAVVFSGIDVVERLPHSRPSAYIPMGLDSTVVYPQVDLKVKNPHPFPVVIHAKTEGAKLRVEVLGKEKPLRVSFGREVVETLPYTRKVLEESGLSARRIVVKQHGIRGYKIKRSRVLVYPDGTERKEESTDTYPPTTEIYQVPPGFDLALLPALPGDAASGEDSAQASASAEGKSPPTLAADSTIVLIDAPGTHAPTSAQMAPAKTLWLNKR